jgi:hypothetical protein
MGKSDGKEYEKIVAAIHKQFAGNASISEDQEVIGKSGRPRQIDVAIHSAILGYSVFIVVECKDYKRRVDVGKIDELIGKIEDVGADKGVLVSDSGFTEGAIQRARQDGRIQLSSVIDVQNEKLKSKVYIPCMVEYRYPLVQFSINETGIVPFSIDGMFMDDLRTRFIHKWNNDELDTELGEHEISETLKDTPEQKLTVGYKYEVRRKLYFKELGMEKAKGIYNHTDGSFTTNEILMERIDNADVQANWQKIDETNIPKVSMWLVGMDVIPERI